MLKSPVDRLNVSFKSVEGDSFADPKFHGITDSVLYAYGRDGIHEYLKLLSRSDYVDGHLGENITLDALDEFDISVGDRFRIGSVLAEATFPRIPCVKLNFRVKHALGQKAMIACGRSGIYFRIIEPGLITRDSKFARVSRAAVPFTIGEVYVRMVGGVQLTQDDLERAQTNGAFPGERLAKWAKAFEVKRP